jgi:hypothetical protein
LSHSGQTVVLYFAVPPALLLSWRRKLTRSVSELTISKNVGIDISGSCICAFIAMFSGIACPLFAWNRDKIHNVAERHVRLRGI